MDPLSKWLVVEHDRVQRYTGAAGHDEPWPVPPTEATLDDRLSGLDSRIRVMMQKVEADVHKHQKSGGNRGDGTKSSNKSGKMSGTD